MSEGRRRTGEPHGGTGRRTAAELQASRKPASTSDRPDEGAQSALREADPAVLSRRLMAAQAELADARARMVRAEEEQAANDDALGKMLARIAEVEAKSKAQQKRVTDSEQRARDAEDRVEELLVEIERAGHRSAGDVEARSADTAELLRVREELGVTSRRFEAERRAAEDAEQALANEREQIEELRVKLADLEIFQVEVEELRGQVTALEGDLGRARRDHDAERLVSKEMERLLAQQRLESERVRAKATEAEGVGEELEEAREELVSRRSEIERLTRQTATLEAERNQARRDLEGAEERLGEKAGELGEAQETIETVNEQLLLLREQLDGVGEIAATANALRASLASVEAERDEARRALAEERRKAHARAEEIAALQPELDKAQSRAALMKADLEVTIKELEGARAGRRELERSLETERARHLEAIESASEEMAGARASITALERRIDDREGEMRDEATSHERQRAALAAANAKALAAIEEQSAAALAAIEEQSAAALAGAKESAAAALAEADEHHTKALAEAKESAAAALAGAKESAAAALAEAEERGAKALAEAQESAAAALAEAEARRAGAEAALAASRVELTATSERLTATHHEREALAARLGELRLDIRNAHIERKADGDRVRESVGQTTRLLADLEARELEAARLRAELIASVRAAVEPLLEADLGRAPPSASVISLASTADDESESEPRASLS